MKNKVIILIFLLLIIASLFSFNDTSTLIFDEQRLDQISENSKPQLYANGILFTYKGEGKVVKLSGSFVKWEKMLLMTKSNFGVWYYFYKETIDKGSYTYKFNVDNFWITDPVNEEIISDNFDHSLSVLTVSEKMINYKKSPFIDENNQFVFWIMNKTADTIYLYGDFNNWNPYELKLEKEGDFWSIRLNLKPGVYAYRFIIDYINEILDPHNNYVLQNKFNEKCSIITVNN